jgi:hypothetical protein
MSICDKQIGINTFDIFKVTVLTDKHTHRQLSQTDTQFDRHTQAERHIHVQTWMKT